MCRSELWLPLLHLLIKFVLLQVHISPGPFDLKSYPSFLSFSRPPICLDIDFAGLLRFPNGLHSFILES